MRKLRLIQVDWDSKWDLSDSRLLTLISVFLKLPSFADLLYHFWCTVRTTGIHYCVDAEAKLLPGND